MEIDNDDLESPISENNQHPNQSTTSPSPPSDDDSATPLALSTSDRDTIHSELEAVESTLARGPGRVGRAAFNSIGSALNSLRRRLTTHQRSDGNEDAQEQEHPNDNNSNNHRHLQSEGDGRAQASSPVTATGTAPAPASSLAENVNADESPSTSTSVAVAAASLPRATDGEDMPPPPPAAAEALAEASLPLSSPSSPQNETQLIRRLERAELAHAHGIPLGMLGAEAQRRQQEEEQAVSNRKSSDEGKRPEDDYEEGYHNNNNDADIEDAVLPDAAAANAGSGEDPSSSSFQSTAADRRRRRESSLVASRQSYQNLRNQAVETEIHGSGNDVVLPRILDDATTSAEEDAKGRDLWTESHDPNNDDDDKNNNNNNNKNIPKVEDPSSSSFGDQDNDIDVVMEDAKPPAGPTSVLYSWGVPENNTLTNKDKNDDDKNSDTTMESSCADTCPQSLHDDEQVRSLTTAKVDMSDRLGRYTIVSLHTGPKHSAVVTATGEVLAAGSNESGQVDPYRRDDVYILKPTLLESLAMARIRQVSCGRSHTAALVAGTGQVLTWGSNAAGQLGRGPTPVDEPHSFRKPAAMILGPGVRASTIAAGHDFTAVLTTRMRLLVCGSQDVVSWNFVNGRAQPRYPSGIAVLEGLPLVQVAAGARHLAVVTQGGMVYSWGHNANGCCGREFPESIHVPVAMMLPQTQHAPPSRDNSSSNNKRTENKLIEYKKQQHNMLEWNLWNGPNTQASLPDDVRIVHAACGQSHTILLTQSGSARVFGLPRGGNQHNDEDETGMVKFQAKILDPPPGRTFIDAAAGDSYSLFLDDMGDVWCLRGDFETARLECVLQGQGIAALSAGGRHAAALSVLPSCASLQREFSTGSEDSTVALTKDPSLLVSAVTSLVPKCKDDSIARAKLVTGTEELFKSPAMWNSLFYNPDDCRDLYSSLLADSTLKQDIATAMERNMLKGLDILRSDDVRMIYPESVRVLWLYLQNPLFSGWRDSNVKFDYRGDVILSLCDAMLSLPFEGYKALMAWATLQYNRTKFREYLVQPLIAQMERGLVDHAGARFRSVPGIVAVLRWLHNAAEQSGVAEAEDFYSDALAAMDPQELYEDLRRYKAASPAGRKETFFICAHAFLLSPTAKRNLLQVEHQVDMLRAATSNVTWDATRRQFVFDPYFVLAIDREYLLQQTLQKIGNASPMELRKSLKVVFKGEDGVDAGGVTKEFFQLLSQELFDVSTGMWSTRFGDSDDDITWFNGDCTWNFDGYYLVGVLVGMAVYNSTLLDVHFPTAVYRKLLGHSLGLEDMVDEEIKNGLQALLDYDGDDVEDIFCLNFEVTWTSLGQEKRIELKPGGANIPVTSSNKEEYVLLYVKWLLVDSIQKQWEAFENGVMHVLESSSLDLLRPEELEKLVVGVKHLDFDALKGNTVYEGGFDGETPVVQNFWKYCQSANQDTLLRLLKFATGSPKAPIGGLGAMSFKIQRAGPDSAQLPTAHTCFNTLLLPDYGDDYDKLSTLLGRAILECEGFGLQ